MMSSAPPPASQAHMPILGDTPADSRRRHDRINLSCPVRVQIKGGLDRDGLVRDLSLQGLSLITTRPVEPGSRCLLQFALPLPTGVRQVALPAKAVYSSYTGPGAFRIGMLFMALAPEDHAAVRQMLG